MSETIGLELAGWFDKHVESRVLGVCYSVLGYQEVSRVVQTVTCTKQKYCASVITKYRLRVFENRVLRKMFGPRTDDATGEWRKVHNEEHNDVYCSLSIIRVIKSRRMILGGHVARMGEGRCIKGFGGET
jgi:hypothetical protein